MTDLATLLKAEVGLRVATADVRVTVVVVTEFGRRVAMNASDSESARSAPFSRPDTNAARRGPHRLSTAVAVSAGQSHVA
jgi:hypothetical protein